MKTKIKRRMLVLGVAIIIATLSIIVIYKIRVQTQIQKKIDVLPTANFFLLDSTSHKLNNARRILLIYFDSTCEHCQNQAIKLKKSIALFSHVQIIMVSSERLITIQSFAQVHKLAMEKVLFLKINPQHIFDTFGSLSVPHIFIYKNGKLSKVFKGETKTENLLTALE